MSAPIINDTTSVLALTRGKYYALQLSVLPGAVPDSWAISGGGLPEGLTLDPDTGKISGTPTRETEGSVFCVDITATNGDGTSAPLSLVIGIERSIVEPSGEVEMWIDVETGYVEFADGRRDDSGRALLEIARGDLFPLSIGFTKRGQVIELDVYQLSLVNREFETDGELSNLDLLDGTVNQVGYDQNARIWTRVDVTDERLHGILYDYEDDRGTWFDGTAQLEFRFWWNTGRVTEAGSGVAAGSPIFEQCIKTTRNFTIRTHRDSYQAA